MWVLPTHKRPEKLQRLLDSLGPEDAEEHVLVVGEMADTRGDDYAAVFVGMPRNWDLLLTSNAVTCSEKLNHVFESFPDEQFYGFLADDVEIGTKNMLPLLRRSAEEGKFAWPDDGVHGPRLSTHYAAPGKMLRALGFWAHPKFQHNYTDSVLYRVATALDICEYFPNLRFIVRHPDLGDKGEDDETYQEGKKLNLDSRDKWYDFEANEQAALVAKVKAAYGIGV